MAAQTFSIGTLKNRVAGYDPAMAASLARIASTGKMPETTRYQEEMIVCRNRIGMMGFFSKVVDECSQGEAVEVFGWYAGQDPATHAPFLLQGPFKFGTPDNKGQLSLSAYVEAATGGKRHTFVKLDGLGVVARENGRRAEYVQLLKAWGISEEDHRSRFDAHAAARKAAADSVAVPSATLAATTPSGVVVRSAAMPSEGRLNDGVVGGSYMSEGDSSVGSAIAGINADTQVPAIA